MTARNFPESEYSDYKTSTEPTKLSLEDSLIFAEAVLNPKEPNKQLKAIFSKENNEMLKALLANKESTDKTMPI